MLAAASREAGKPGGSMDQRQTHGGRYRRTAGGVCACVLLLAVGLAAHATGQQREEYRTTAKQEEVLKSPLVSAPGKEGTILRVELPAGWIGEWHYHTGDVFVYVVSGEFVVDVEGQGRKTFASGEVYHEAVNTTMRARNPAAAQPTRLILFQVGGQGEPLMLRAKPPRR
jgi:quercetin dioxygenase-like cupin family protein